MDHDEKTPTVEENLIAPPLPESTEAGVVIVRSGSSSSCESTSSAESSGSNTTSDSDSQCSDGREKVE